MTRTSPQPGLGVPTGNVYPKYESEHGIERWVVERFLRHLDAVLERHQPHRVLDIGTGEGAIADRVQRLFPTAVVVGVDLNDDGLAAQWRGRAVRATVADATRLPFPAGSFDLVMGIEVLEHLANPEWALAEMARVARGPVVVSVPQEPLWRFGNLVSRRYWRTWGNTPGHVQHWSSRAFCRLVSRYLQVVELRRPLPWTMIVAERRPS